MVRVDLRREREDAGIGSEQGSSRAVSLSERTQALEVIKFMAGISKLTTSDVSRSIYFMLAIHNSRNGQPHPSLRHDFDDGVSALEPCDLVGPVLRKGCPQGTAGMLGI